MENDCPPLKTGPEFLAEVQAYLAGADLFHVTAGDAAQALGLSLDDFKTYLQLSRTTWQAELVAERRRRLEIAVKEDPSKSAPHYAERCGYLDYQTFYRQFKVWYGMGFGEWKKGVTG